jgi:hypothetical protein
MPEAPSREEKMRLKLKNVLVSDAEPEDPLKDIEGKLERGEITQRIAKTDRGGFMGAIRMHVNEYIQAHPSKIRNLEAEGWDFTVADQSAAGGVTMLAPSHTGTWWAFGPAAIRNIYTGLTDTQCFRLSELMFYQDEDQGGAEMADVVRDPLQPTVPRIADTKPNTFIEEGFELEYTRKNEDGEDEVVGSEHISYADRFVFNRTVAFEIAKKAGQVPQDMPDGTLLQTEHGLLLEPPMKDD